jgi:hypothetical protein
MPRQRTACECELSDPRKFRRRTSSVVRPFHISHLGENLPSGINRPALQILLMPWTIATFPITSTRLSLVRCVRFRSRNQLQLVGTITQNANVVNVHETGSQHSTQLFGIAVRNGVDPLRLDRKHRGGSRRWLETRLGRKQKEDPKNQDGSHRLHCNKPNDSWRQRH